MAAAGGGVARLRLSRACRPCCCPEGTWRLRPQWTGCCCATAGCERRPRAGSRRHLPWQRPLTLRWRHQGPQWAGCHLWWGGRVPATTATAAAGSDAGQAFQLAFATTRLLLLLLLLRPSRRLLPGHWVAPDRRLHAPAAAAASSATRGWWGGQLCNAALLLLLLLGGRVVVKGLLQQHLSRVVCKREGGSKLRGGRGAPPVCEEAEEAAARRGYMQYADKVRGARRCWRLSGA
jgi:hypothetical protein